MQLLKKLIFFVLLFFLLLDTCSTRAELTLKRNPLSHKNLKVYILENGLTLIIKENHNLPLVSVDLWVKAGTAYETKQNFGITHLLENMLFKKSQYFKKNYFVNFIQQKGFSFSGNTSWDFAHYLTTLNKKNLNFLLKLEADYIFNPVFSEEEIFKEKENLVEEIKERQLDPQKKIADLIRQLTYGEHPYSQLLFTTAENIRKLNKNILDNFHKDFYVPNNMYLVIAGDVKNLKVLEEVTKYFGKFKPQEIMANFTGENPLPLTEKKVKIINEDIQIGLFNLAFLAPNVLDKPDVYAMDLILTILGEGDNSRLKENLLKNNLALDMKTEFLTQADKGIFIIKAFYPQKNYEQVLQTTLEEIEKLKNTAISQSELENAKIKLLSSICNDVQTNSGITSYYGFYSVIDKIDFAITYLPEIFKITSGDIKKTAQKYFYTDKYILVAVKPKK